MLGPEYWWSITAHACCTSNTKNDELWQQ